MARWSDATEPQAKALIEIRDGLPVTARAQTMLACKHASWFIVVQGGARTLTPQGKAALDAYLARQNPSLPRGSLTDQEA